jgi:hypothetical protein
MNSENRRHFGQQALAAATGLAALAWFLLRVIPKPARAAYPCQRAAAPLASGFVVWLAGLIGVRALHIRARRLPAGSRYALVAVALTAAVVFLWMPLGVVDEAIAQRGGDQSTLFQPTEAVNSPMGVGKGLHPGRVVWVRDVEATSWDGATGRWWDDANSNQAVVDGMMSKALQNIAGQKTDKQAWDALFRQFNQAHNSGKAGYTAGEKIAIKINANQDRSPEWGTGQRPLNGLPSPHVVYTLLAQLIQNGGVRGQDITLYDATGGRNIGDPIYKKVRANQDANFQAIRFVSGPDWGRDGRVAATPDKANPVRFAQTDLPPAYLPAAVTEAKYLINLALLRPHGMMGVTLTAKNHFGSVYFDNSNTFSPRNLHNCAPRTLPMGSYNCLVDLIGHKQLGGKTLLYMLDGLYTAEHNEGNVFKWASYGDDWASSLLMSQDPVAIDSVGLDILRSEPKATQVRGNADNYLHEAALAGKPPSGTKYDPEGDGTPLASLGVHEHWNNPTDKKYSRNLGKREGIELVALGATAQPRPAAGAAAAGK